MHEDLTKAYDCANFAAGDLRAALAKADPVEALVLLPLIADAERLKQNISAFMDARRAPSEYRNGSYEQAIGRAMR